MALGGLFSSEKDEYQTQLRCSRYYQPKAKNMHILGSPGVFQSVLCVLPIETGLLSAHSGTEFYLALCVTIHLKTVLLVIHTLSPIVPNLSVLAEALRKNAEYIVYGN